MTTELGTRQYCRDNVTIFNTKLFVFAILLYLLWLLHPDTETKIFLDFFSDHWGSITLSGCCVVVIAKLKNCRVPSSGWQHVCESILFHERAHLFRPEYRKSRGNLKLLMHIVYVFSRWVLNPTRYTRKSWTLLHLLWGTVILVFFYQKIILFFINIAKRIFLNIHKKKLLKHKHKMRKFYPAEYFR